MSETKEEVYTKLLFHELNDYTNQEEYVLRFHHQQLPPLEPNQISIAGVRLERFDEDVLIHTFIRNTLPKGIRFEEVDLLLVEEGTGNVWARKTFDLSEMGELPPLSSYPWVFEFEQEDYLISEIPTNGWQIAFELKQQESVHSLDLAPSWQEQLTLEQKKRLEEIVKGLPKIGDGEVNFTGLEASVREDGSVTATVLIRNGNKRSVKIEQLPLVLEDATMEQVCRGSFKLTDFEVKANATKPWTFIFPANLVAKKNPDLSKWKVYIPK